MLINTTPAASLGSSCKALGKSDPATLKALLAVLIARLDEHVNRQLNEVLHHPKLQALEASWRGLKYLAVIQAQTTNTRLKVLDIHWHEVVRDTTRAFEFDQSELFSKIYANEFGIAGGEPFGALIGDYFLSHRGESNDDPLIALQGIAQIAAAAFAPFITGVDKAMFGLEDFAGLRSSLDFDAILAGAGYDTWQDIRNHPDARFIGLALPGILMRHPYRPRAGSCRGLCFHETVASTSDYVWGNAAYAFGAVVLREFHRVAWFAHIRGVPQDAQGGGLVRPFPCDLPHDQSSDSPFNRTETVITDMLETQLCEQGFMPLCQNQGLSSGAFYSNASIQRPHSEKSRPLTQNTQLIAMLQHMLCASRIAHYVKVMIRDKIGSFKDAGDCERFLRNWLYRYTTGRADLDWEARARYPLKESQVIVHEHPLKPEQYICTIRLVPHYQAEQMVSELELSTELAASGDPNK